MKILLYKGKSIISRLIKIQTRSKYSHAAVMMHDGSVIEAWAAGGVRRIPNPFEGHTKGTPIDVYTVEAGYNSDLVEQYLSKQIGKKYDYKSVGRFLSRRSAPDNNKAFCSELVLEAFRNGKLKLLNGNPAEQSPRDVGMCPYLKFEKSIRS
jgi:uncharacterized protein YycO